MIVLKIIGALRRFLQRRITRLVAGETPAIAKRRELELDHLGAELGEDAPAGRRGDELPDIEHAVAFEHRQIGRHRAARL